MESASQDYAPAKPAKRKFSAKWIILIVVLALLIGGGVFFAQSMNSSSDNISPTPTQFPTEVPTPEITETASPSAAASGSVTPSSKPSPTRTASVKSATDMNIQILNGSGEVGVAGNVKDYLSGKGYKYFETGNADNFDYQNVTLKVKSTLTTYGATLQKDLSAKYTMASDSAQLPADSVFDAVVIVGK